MGHAPPSLRAHRGAANRQPPTLQPPTAKPPTLQPPTLQPPTWPPLHVVAAFALSLHDPTPVRSRPRRASTHAPGARRPIEDPAKSRLYLHEACRIPLSRRLDGRAPWIRDQLPPGHAHRAARVLGARLEDVIDTLEAWRDEAGWPLDLGGVADPPERDEERRVASSRHGDGHAPALAGVVPVGHVAWIALRLGCSMSRVADLLAEAWLERGGGFVLHPLPPSVSGAPPLHEDLVALSVNLDGRPPWIEGEVPIGHLVGLAQALQRSLLVAHGRLERFAPNVRVRVSRDQLEALDERVIKDHDRRLLSQDLNGRGPWLSGEVAPEQLLRASAALGWPIAAVCLRLEVYRDWITLPRLDAFSACWTTATGDEVRLLSSELDGRPPWVGMRVPEAHLRRASEALKRPEPALTARLRELWRPFRADVKITRERPSIAGHPDADLRVLASVNLDGAAPWLDYASPMHLLRASHRLGWPVRRTWERLEALQPYGILRPSGRRIPADLRVTDADMVVLNEVCRGDGWRSCWVVAGRMLRRSVAHGTTMRAERARVAVFEAVGIDLPHVSDHVADHRFDEADVRLLYDDTSADLPKVNGRFTATHLVDAAIALDEPLGAVMERVRRLRAAGLPTSILWYRSQELGAARACPELLALAHAPYASALPPGEHLRIVGRALGALIDQGMSAPAAIASASALARLRSYGADYLVPLITLAAQPFDETDLRLLACWCAYDRNPVVPLTILELCEAAGVGADEAIARTNEIVYQLDLPLESPARLLPGPEAYEVLSRELDGRPPWRRGRVTPQDVQAIALVVDLSPEVVLGLLRRWVGEGWELTLPELR